MSKQKNVLGTALPSLLWLLLCTLSEAKSWRRQGALPARPGQAGLGRGDLQGAENRLPCAGQSGGWRGACLLPTPCSVAQGVGPNAATEAVTCPQGTAGSRSGNSGTCLQSRGWREFRSSVAGRSLQLTVWSVAVVLILAEFKLLRQNGSVRLSRLQEAQPPGVSQPPPGSRGTDRHPWWCPGQRSCTMRSWLIYRGLLPLQPTHPTGFACRGGTVRHPVVGSWGGDKVHPWPFPLGATFAVGWLLRPMLAYG